MSREVYSISQSVIRSPGKSRRLTELPTVDRSPSREFFKREIASKYAENIFMIMNYLMI